MKIAKNENLNFIRFLYLNFYKKYMKSILLVCCLIIILSLLILPTPLITRRIIDVTLPGKNLTELIVLVGITLSILLFQNAVAYIHSLMLKRVNDKIILDIKVALLERLNNAPLSTINKYSSGYLLSRINSDSEGLRSFFAETFVAVLKDLLYLIAGLSVIFTIHFKLALFSVILIIPYVWLSVFFGKRIKAQTEVTYEVMAKSVSTLEQCLSLIRLIKQFLRSRFSIYQFFSSSKSAYRESVKLTKITSIYQVSSNMIIGLIPLIIIGYGGYEIINDRLTIGSMIAFNSFIRYLFNPARNLIDLNVRLQTAMVSLKRVKEIMTFPSEVIDYNYNISVIERLSIRELKFFYKEDKPILENVNIEINQGEKIGIVGVSGCGKTTLLKILSGLHKSISGEIYINGDKLSDSQIVALRKYIGIVDQEPVLIDGSIMDNIRFANMSAGYEDVVAVCKMASVHAQIMNLPDKYDTHVGVKGNSLSIGQKQRISLARALIKNPKILLLDEATSNIDPISEKSIMETLHKLPDDIIVIIVAHRLSTIKECDKICVMSNGAISEEGSHGELMEVKGEYFNMLNHG